MTPAESRHLGRREQIRAFALFQCAKHDTKLRVGQNPREGGYRRSRVEISQSTGQQLRCAGCRLWRRDTKLTRKHSAGIRKRRPPGEGWGRPTLGTHSAIAHQKVAQVPVEAQLLGIDLADFNEPGINGDLRRRDIERLDRLLDDV